MKAISIFNHVLGPVMRGPSSSHTAGAFHIACMARTLLGGIPSRARFACDPTGSYAATYAQQGADRAFAMGLMNKPLVDESFFTALKDASAAGMDLRFEVRPLTGADHPNTVDIEVGSQSGVTLRLRARSIGGGEVEITAFEGWPVLLNGTAYETLVMAPAPTVGQVCTILAADGALLGEAAVQVRGDQALVSARRTCAVTPAIRAALQALGTTVRVAESAPVYFVQKGRPWFSSAAEMIERAEQEGFSLGETALEYESRLLGIPREEVVREMLFRYDIMARAAEQGLRPDIGGMQLLRPSAGAIFRAEAEGKLSARSINTRAAARAMAVMHVNSAMGVVCAAPTGGSAGALPGAVVTLVEERSLSREATARAMLAAGAIGAILATRATFAAEVAGCQVEIGAGGAMGAAAVVDGAGGTVRQAADAAAIAFQNTMGSICDLVQGMVEIPCHTRNAVAAANAFTCADLILGGYQNPIPLDETIDAVYAVGKMLPAELRCTAKGGLAITPSALAMKPHSCTSNCPHK